MCAALLALLLCQEDGLQDLIRKLGAGSFEEQGRAADALAARGPEAVAVIEKLKSGENPDLAAWADRILSRIRAMDAKIRPWIEKLGSADDEIKEQAEAALRKMGSAAIPWLRDAAQSDSKNLRRRAEALLEALGESTEEPSHGGRLGSRLGGKKNLVARGGGGADTEDVVLRALQWLARHQGEDGSWSVTGLCKTCRPNPGRSDFDGGVTGLALLAFLGAGYTHLSKDEFGPVVKKGLQWVLAQQDQDGCIGARGEKYMYNHLLCAFALVEAYGLTGSNLVKDPAQKAVDFTVGAQNPDRGWRYSYRCGDSDTSVTGWAVQVLRAAEISGLSFPKAGYDGARNWIDQVTEDQYYRVGYTHKGTGKVFIPGVNEEFNHHETLTAMGMTSRIFIDKNKRDPKLAGGAQLLVRDLPKWDDHDIDFYYWHHATVALFQYDGPGGGYWKQWNESLKGALVKNQNGGKECKSGSWEPVDRWSGEGGRVYATAINALTMETYYRYPSVSGNK